MTSRSRGRRRPRRVARSITFDRAVPARGLRSAPHRDAAVGDRERDELAGVGVVGRHRAAEPARPLACCRPAAAATPARSRRRRGRAAGARCRRARQPTASTPARRRPPAGGRRRPPRPVSGGSISIAPANSVVIRPPSLCDGDVLPRDRPFGTWRDPAGGELPTIGVRPGRNRGVATRRTCTDRHLRKESTMSFQAYLDAIEDKTGCTPRQLVDQATARGFGPGTKATPIVAWLQADHGLGRGHAMALVHVITKGPRSATSTSGRRAATATRPPRCGWTGRRPSPPDLHPASGPALHRGVLDGCRDGANWVRWERIDGIRLGRHCDGRTPHPRRPAGRAPAARAARRLRRRLVRRRPARRRARPPRPPPATRRPTRPPSTSSAAGPRPRSRWRTPGDTTATISSLTKRMSPCCTRLAEQVERFYAATVASSHVGLDDHRHSSRRAAMPVRLARRSSAPHQLRDVHREQSLHHLRERPWRSVN